MEFIRGVGFFFHIEQNKNGLTLDNVCLSLYDHFSKMSQKYGLNFKWLQCMIL